MVAAGTVSRPNMQRSAPLATWKANALPYHRQKSGSFYHQSASTGANLGIPSSSSPAGEKQHKHILRALQAHFLLFDPESTGLVPMSMLPRCLVAVGIHLPPGPLAAVASLIARPDRLCSWRALLRWLKANPELISPSLTGAHQSIKATAAPEAKGGGVPTGMQTPGGTPAGGGNLHARLVATLADVTRPGARSAAAAPSTAAAKAPLVGSAARLRPVSSGLELPRVGPHRARGRARRHHVRPAAGGVAAFRWRPPNGARAEPDPLRQKMYHKLPQSL